MDYSKYYDNIRHDELYDRLSKYVQNDTALWLMGEILKRSSLNSVSIAISKVNVQ